MTGEKNKYKTHEQLWKLEDGELSTPKHDELVLQLMNPINAIKIVNYNPDICSSYMWYFNKIHLSDAARELTNTIKENFMNMESEYNCPNIKTEVPITNGTNNFIIGYIDIQITFTHFYEFFFTSDNDPHKLTIRDGSKFSQTDRIKYAINRYGYEGQIEVYTDYYKASDIKQELYNIEVKPTIQSFGETMRQINTYRQYNPNAIYVIYSPDINFKRAFEHQGVRFISPTDLGIK